jgi:hypothetical protein
LRNILIKRTDEIDFFLQLFDVCFHLWKKKQKKNGIKIIVGNGGKGAMSNYEIREVWAYNLAEEMDNIRQLVDEYPCISMVPF